MNTLAAAAAVIVAIMGAPTPAIHDIDTGHEAAHHAQQHPSKASTTANDIARDEFDEDALTVSAVHDGVYYLYVPYDMTDSEFDASKYGRECDWALDRYGDVTFVGPGGVYGDDEYIDIGEDEVLLTPDASETVGP